MNIKIIGAIVLVFAVTAGILFAFNNGSLGFSGSKKSEAFLRCEQLVNDIKGIDNCDQKWSLFKEKFQGCEKFPPTEPSEGQLEVTTFRDVVFHIGECFTRDNKNEKALEVYDRGLQFEEWMQDDHFNTYSAHFLLNRARDLVLPSKNPQCFTKEAFGKQIQKFVATADAEDIKALLYSDNVLDTQVMSSDAGGYLSYQEWKKVFEENKSQLQLKYLKETEQNCFVTTGWEQDYPWRAFCAEKIGPQGCYYLMNIYAGIEASLEDFEQFKKVEVPQ